MSGGRITNKKIDDGRFKDRLQILDSHTGSLIIKNIKHKHSGRYEAEINHAIGTAYKRFRVTVKDSPRVIGAGAGDVKSVSVSEGESVTLHTDVQTHRDDLILWRFGDEGLLIAKHDKEDNKSSIYDDGRFRDRLTLDDRTRSLIITNTKTTDTGLYKLQISSNRDTKYKTFSVSVSEPDLSAGQVTGIIFGVLMVIAAVGVVIVYRCIKYELQKQKVEVMTVIEGYSVALESDVTELQSDDVIQLSFRDEVIAAYNKNNKISSVVRFRDRLKVDDQTGSLIIRDIRTEDAGLYKVKISSSSGEKSFLQFITCGGPSYSQLSVIVKVIAYEGESVTLHSDSEIQRVSEIKWISEDNIILVTGKIGVVIETKCTDDERFRARLKMNHQTGDLTITKIRKTDDGVYKLQQISSDGKISYKMINVFVNDGPSADQKQNSVRKYENDSVTLNTGVTELQSDDVIQWRFGETLIAEINRKNKFTTDDETFKDRLKLNDKTGDLIIRDLDIEHTGLYKLKIINSRGASCCQIEVDVEERIRSVKSGGSVTLYTDVTGIQTDDEIQWRFGDEETLIAEVTVGAKPSYDSTDERFTDRLKMNIKTGHLTITHITAELSGVYRAKISSRRRETEYRRYRVDIRVIADRGESVTLNTESKIQRGSEIKWISEDKTILVTGKNGDDRETKCTDDERFRDRLKMNHQTGDLTITDIRQTDAGLYTLQINSDGKISNRIFRVYVRGE
ncbi:uncharacterized protein LOC130549481 [Triplophysa rosa]|uniref:uncharacterized protein LOC130549481 n=1 Tax=Triplophysa rosa TaxID=992332 RepID=UPI002545FDC9|nr:uncharacterized protein LOC130549481 [Triplophysa rosa]